MATLDIRKCECEEITEIQFDTSVDRVTRVGDFIQIGRDSTYVRVNRKHIDDLIRALQKAQELWC